MPITPPTPPSPPTPPTVPGAGGGSDSGAGVTITPPTVSVGYPQGDTGAAESTGEAPADRVTVGGGAQNAAAADAAQGRGGADGVTTQATETEGARQTLDPAVIAALQGQGVNQQQQNQGQGHETGEANQNVTPTSYTATGPLYLWGFILFSLIVGAIIVRRFLIAKKRTEGDLSLKELFRVPGRDRNGKRVTEERERAPERMSARGAAPDAGSEHGVRVPDADGETDIEILTQYTGRHAGELLRELEARKPMPHAKIRAYKESPAPKKKRPTPPPVNVGPKTQEPQKGSTKKDDDKGTHFEVRV